MMEDETQMEVEEIEENKLFLVRILLSTTEYFIAYDLLTFNLTSLAARIHTNCSIL